MATWYNDNRALNREEMEHNALLIYKRFSGLWHSNPIFAALGNMEAESTINPGRWQTSFPPYHKSSGYGLVQWTPWTKYSQWAGKNWEGNGDLECDRIEYEWRNEMQWVKKINISFDAFTQSDASIEYLTEVWVRNYERPAVVNLEPRIKAALYWAKYLEDVEPSPTPPPEQFRGIYLWLRFYLKNKRDTYGKYRTPHKL